MPSMTISKQFQYPIRSVINIFCAFLSAIGSIILVSRAAHEGTVWHVVSFSIYGASLTALWTVSAIYHSLNATNKILERLDHAMIYFLIAGTYTPICLVVLQGGWGWSLFGINWVLAVTGIVLKLVVRRPSRGMVVVLFIFYILMGWLIVVAWPPLVRALPEPGVFWLVLGGIFYTVGAAILNIKRFDVNPQFGSHEIWHLFVMAGSFCHYWLMLKYVLYVNGFLQEFP